MKHLEKIVASAASLLVGMIMLPAAFFALSTDGSLLITSSTEGSSIEYLAYRIPIAPACL